MWSKVLLSVAVAHTWMMMPMINADKFVLMFGESQMGKSSFVKQLLHENGEQGSADSVRVGTGTGASVTDRPSMYAVNLEGERVVVMDTPGNLDTQLRWSAGNALLQNIEAAIMSSDGVGSTGGVDAILVTESLAADRQQLASNLKDLASEFGTKVLESVVVLGTKPAASRLVCQSSGCGDQDLRIKKVAEICQRFNVPFVLYESREGKRESVPEHYQNARDLVSLITGQQVHIAGQGTFQLQRLPMSALEEMKAALLRKASALRDAAPKTYERQQHDYQRQVARGYEADRHTGVEMADGVVGYDRTGFAVPLLFSYKKSKAIMGKIPVDVTSKVTEYSQAQRADVQLDDVQQDQDINPFLALAGKIATGVFKKKFLLNIDEES